MVGGEGCRCQAHRMSRVFGLALPAPARHRSACGHGNNGPCPQAQGAPPTYYGYEARATSISSGSLVLMINRVNADGTVTSLYTNASSPHTGVDLAKWSTLSVKVDVGSSKTDLTIMWDGVSANGLPVSHSATVSDSSADRWTQGAGIALSGHPGSGPGGLAVDDLTVIGSYTGIRSSKLAPDGVPVNMEGAVITRSFADMFYVESEDRSHGIRVNWPNNRLAAGSRVTVAGVASTTNDGERCINASAAVRTASGSIAPLAMNNASLGGADWFYDPLRGTGQRGVVGGIGPCNIGLLVRTTGVVTEQTGSGIKISDGSGADMAVSVPSSISPVPVGSYVAITAISSCTKAPDGSLHPLLLVRASSDIVRIVEP